MGKIRSVLALLVSGVLIVSCATPYKAIGFKGGYSQVRYDENTFMVSFSGNAFTPRNRVETFLLYRCAEVTADAGYDYFIIVKSGTASRITELTSPGQYTSNTNITTRGMGNMVYGTGTTTGTYKPPETTQLTSYSSSALIKVFKGDKPVDNPSAYVARDIIQYLGPSIVR